MHGSRAAADSDGRLVCYSDDLRVVVAEDQRTILDVRRRDDVATSAPRREERVERGKKGKGGHRYPTSAKGIYQGVKEADGWSIDQGRHGVYAVSPDGARVRLPALGGGQVLTSTLKNVCTSLRHAGLDLRS